MTQAQCFPMQTPLLVNNIYVLSPTSKCSPEANGSESFGQEKGQYSIFMTAIASVTKTLQSQLDFSIDKDEWHVYSLDEDVALFSVLVPKVVANLGLINLAQNNA